MSPSRNLTNLDFIRSVAVLLVAMAHLFLYTGHLAWIGWSGITGVSVFFVHTSLVLMMSLERDPQVGRFYIRRVFRIYPLWLFVLVLTLLVKLPMSPVRAPEFVFRAPGWRELVGNVLLMGNLGAGMNLIGASWTLPIEVQMYLFLPFLFFFARSTTLLWPLLLVDGFVVLYLQRTGGVVGATLLTCIPYFLPGVMAYVLTKRTRLRVLPAWMFVPFFLAMVGVDHVYGSLERSWLFCLVLGVTLPLFRDMTMGPMRVMSHFVARYSYGVYLSHIMAIALAVHGLRGHSLGLRVLVFLGMFCGLPVVFYHLIEEPAMRLGSKIAKRIGHGRMPSFGEKTIELEPAP